MVRVRFIKPGPGLGLAYHIGEEADFDVKKADELIKKEVVIKIEAESIETASVEPDEDVEIRERKYERPVSKKGRPRTRR